MTFILFPVNKGAKITLSVIVSIMFVAVLILFYRFDPEAELLFPKCPFLLFTGYECPGCGSQRAIHSLLHFKIGAAWRYNAFMVLVVPYLFLGIYLEYFDRRKRHSRLKSLFFGRWSAMTIFIVIIVYWVLRNLN